MTSLKALLLTLLAVLCVAMLGASPSFAQGANGATYNGSYPNSLGASYMRVFKGYGTATANQTFATTSYADLSGASVSVTPFRYDPTTPSASVLEVKWNADATKATATTGTCAVVYNGSVQASSARTVASAGGQDVLAGDFLMAETTQGPVTVKIQCKSGDTNTLTIANAQVTVDELVYQAPTNP